MEKHRVYELAKELNTTSKRLMEKLGEINVNVKNHMSLLADNELDALYKHIGIMKQAEKKEDSEERKHASPGEPKAEHKKEVSKDIKHAPRIIRKTEIVIDSKAEANDFKQQSKTDFAQNEQRGDVRGNNRDNYRRDSVRVSDSNSGLRQGYTRDSKQGFANEFGQGNRGSNYQNQKENIKVDQVKEAPSKIKEETIQAKVAQHMSSENENQKHEETLAKETKAGTENIIANVESIKTTEGKHAEEATQIKVQPQEPSKEISSLNEKESSSTIENKSTPAEGANANGFVERKPNTYQSNQGGYNRPQGDRPQGSYNQGGYNRPQGDRPQGDRPQGSYNQGGYNRPQGDRPQGDRPQGSYNQGGYNRPQGDRPQGDRPQGSYNQGGYNRPQGDRPQGDRPQGSYNQGGYNRPQGDRPQGDRPQGSYNQGGYNRPQGDRPQGDRPQGSYNQGGYNRPQGDRPQGSYNQGGYNRPQGDRPQGSYNQGGYNRPQGDRPQGSYNQGGYSQGGYNRPQGDRSQGGYNQGGYNQGGYNKDGYNQGGYNRSQGARPLDIPKPELSDAQKEELALQKIESRREFQSKDIDKDVKREQKKDIPKGQQAAERNKRFKPQNLSLGEKKGVSEVLSEDFILNEFYSDDDSKKARRQNRGRRDNKAAPRYIPPRAVLTSVTIPEIMIVKDLAEILKKTSTDVIKKLMGLGMMATVNQEVDFDTAAIIAEEFGIKATKEIVINEEDILFDEDDINEDKEKLIPRPPVVVVMGHVDHGKTSLLDAIREENVIDSEAGGITQHIGAYMVKINNRNITFLDTPGHEAFTAMRARGAQVTDIAILVVAADDGVMPQTIEAINHAKAANVSIIVAINKMDKPGANPEKVKQEMTEHGLVSEEWGGDVIFVPVSAKKRENIDTLLEMVVLTADVLELKANPDRQAKGTIIEAKLDKDKGPIATVLVQRGTLQLGDSIVTGTTVGRIRAMVDDKGHKIKKAGPSTPVEILGLPSVPEAGEIFYAITDEKVAKQLAEKRKFKQREEQLKASAKVSLEDLYTQIKAGKVKDLNLIVKADVQGSVEAVKQSLLKLTSDEVRIKIIHDGVGAINEADVTLAEVSNAIIIGFNVRPGTNVGEKAKNVGVDLRLYRVIYNAIEDVQAAMKGMLDPTYKEVIQGHAEIRQIIKVSGVGTIGGSYVTDGKIIRNTDVRLVREGIVVHEGKLSSLRRFKDDVKEVAQGYECGISLEKFNDIREGDIVESFVMEEVVR